MIKGAEPISWRDFTKGLVTRADFLKGDVDASPNTMDIQWRFDASLNKRLGSSSTNSVVLTSTTTSGWTLDTNSSLSTNLRAWWKMDEASGTRTDQIGTNNLTDYGAVGQITGIRNQAANFVRANSQCLSVSSSSDLQVNSSNYSISAWFQAASLPTAEYQIIAKRGLTSSADAEYQLYIDPTINRVSFGAYSDGGTGATTVTANSFGALQAGSWYHVVAWVSGNLQLGVSLNLSVNTISFANTIVTTGTGVFQVGATSTTTAGGATSQMIDARVDEVGVWKKVLSAQERSDLYGGGSGNTYAAGAGGGGNNWGWASFDFGASAIRWLTVAAGTGILASSNRGTTFVNIATTRTASYQSFERSKNVLIATSDLYDVPLYWAGSAGTSAITLAAGSAPAVKFAVNYAGWLILLNSSLRRHGFFYADENLQLTDPWTTAFDLPTSADDEITAAFVLNKFLYVSTRYRIFRVVFVGGNPDWNFTVVKYWGFVPRTVQVVTLPGEGNFITGGQVAVGMDWDRRMRIFDGYLDHIISNAIEINNGMCDFAMNKVSYAGSGLQVSHAMYDPINQEYRLNVAIGAASTQTTHAIILNLRNMAFYPYSNQGWQTMCVAESNNQRALMAVDRSGFVYLLNSGNLDYGTTAISEVYDSPILFSKVPETVSKGKQLNLFLGVTSSGTLYYQDRVDLSSVWSGQTPLSDGKGNAELKSTDSAVKLQRNINIPAIYNAYQFRITGSGSTTNAANSWELDRIDYLQQGFGIGRGN